MPVIKRYPPLQVDEVLRRLDVDLNDGRCYWIDPSPQHAGLISQEAGYARWNERRDRRYWMISLAGIQYKRAYIVFLVAKGYWPEMIDHADGNPLNDHPSNLREATLTQNNWNHRGRRKKDPTPMGIRTMPNGRFQARIALNKKSLCLGTFDTLATAHAVYSAKRKELYGAFSGRS